MRYIFIFLFAIVYFFNVQGQKNLGIDSSPNFRSLCGLENKNNGRKIKEGLIFRSGSFSYLNDLEKDIIGNLGINTIIDFRGEDEIKRDPDYIPENSAIRYINTPIGNVGNNNGNMNAFLKLLMQSDLKQENVDTLMMQMNKQFVENITDFHSFIDEIINPHSIILFHCSAGKDRTGLASALLLHILGFDKEAIMQDFLKSNEAVGKLDYSRMTAYGIPENNLKKVMGVKESYLNTAFETIESKYGNIDNMLLEVFNIDDSVKKSIREKYFN